MKEKKVSIFVIPEFSLLKKRDDAVCAATGSGGIGDGGKTDTGGDTGGGETGGDGGFDGGGDGFDDGFDTGFD